MLLTIVTITYNAERTIGRTLDSLERQTCAQDIEHIIVDGASTDNTVALALDYKQRNPARRIIVHSEPDRGLYDAMNKGLHMAQGTYICFLNAGDKLHSPTTIEHMKPLMQKATYGVIYGDTDIVDSEGCFIRKRHLTPPQHLTSRSFSDGMLVCHQSFYALRRLCPDYDLRYRFSADVDWCIRVMQEGERQGLDNCNMHAVLTDYLDEGITTNNHRASLIERFNVMRHHYGLATTLGKHFTFLFRQH